MAELKTKKTEADVAEFIHSFADSAQKREDSFRLLQIFEDVTGFAPKMWGPSIIGFGSYHYQSGKGGQEAEWPLVGFSPRKAAISLYVFTGSAAHEHLLENLGKFKKGKACIYIKKLADIDEETLKTLVKATVRHYQTMYPQRQLKIHKT